MREHFNDAAFSINQVENQYELKLGDQVAFLEFVTKDDKVYLTHTNVPKSLEGKGFGSELVKQSLDHLMAQDVVVMPLCSFVAHYIDNHPEYQSLLSDGYQM